MDLMASGTGPEESYWQQLIKSGLYLAHWQKERDHDFSQPLVLLMGRKGIEPWTY